MRGRWSSSVLSYCKNCVVKETQINTESTIVLLRQDLPSQTGPRSAVGNVSGYRCVSDCNSRGREFDPGPVPYFRGD